ALEAGVGAIILFVSWGYGLDSSDGPVENARENRLKVGRFTRQQRRRVVILLYWKRRHPDHYTASVLGYEACFLAGLAKLDFSAAVPAAGGSSAPLRAGRPQDSRQDAGATNLAPHRPFKIIYAMLYYDIRPTFVVDITEQFETRLQSLMAYKSQFADQEAGKAIFPAEAEIRSRVEAMARY